MATAILLVVLAGTLLAAAALLAVHLQSVYEGRPGRALAWLRPVERSIYRVMRIDPEHDMAWGRYARAVLAFSLVSTLFLYALQRLQGVLPLNPADMKAVRPDLAFNTAVSFVTNTNWQSSSPELTMSYLTQMIGLAVQNFASAAVGMAVAVALVRGFVRSESGGIGNFWADLVRGTLYVLVPLALVVGVVLLARGVVQTFDGPVTVHDVRRRRPDDRRGPFASQEAIKELGTNGGGSFNANSSHPFENPTPFTNLLEIWSLLLIPFAMPFLFGRMLGRMREGIALLAVMLLLLGTAFGISLASETRTTPALTAAGLDARAQHRGQGAALRRRRRRRSSASPPPARRPARSTRCTTPSPPSAVQCP